MYTFHENVINREAYSTWGQQLEVTPIKSRVDASFKIIETDRQKTMSIGKTNNNNIKIRTDEKGHVIERIFASNVESVEDNQSVGTIEPEITDSESIQEEHTDLEYKEKVQIKKEGQNRKKKSVKMPLSDTKIQDLLQTINDRARLTKRKLSYKEYSEGSTEEEEDKENKISKKKLMKPGRKPSITRITIPPERITISAIPSGITKMAGVMKPTGQPRVMLERVQQKQLEKSMVQQSEEPPRTSEIEKGVEETQPGDQEGTAKRMGVDQEVAQYLELEAQAESVAETQADSQ